MKWYIHILKNYVNFSGRARREEYWMFFLFHFIFSLVIGFVDGLIGTAGILTLLYSLAVFVPSIAVGFRRLHDTGRSAWWVLTSLIPLVGAIILLVFMCSDSQKHDNKYGPNPKELPMNYKLSS